MAEFSDSDKPDITSREHLRRQQRLARHQIRLRGIRTIVLSIMALAVFAAVFDAPYAEWVLAGAALTITLSLIVERHLIHRYLIDTLADEIVYLAIVADPGHCSVTYTVKLATIPPAEVHAALRRLQHTHRITGKLEEYSGHDVTTYHPTHD